MRGQRLTGGHRSWGAVPLGALGCGAAASLFGPRTGLWLDCAVILLAPAILWASPVRTRRELAGADGLERAAEAGAPARAGTAGEG